MSRVAAGIGGVAGAAVGGVLGLYLGELIPPQPGYMPKDDESLITAVILGVAAIGGFTGAFLGAGPEPQSLKVGVAGHLQARQGFP